jgi:gliding motility-associated-like protein
MCVGATGQLTDSVSGGTWSSATPSIAGIDGLSGLVTGATAGTCNITYSVAGCNAVTVVTIDPNPPAITGLNSLCTQASETLTDGIPGGTWSTSNGVVATVDPASGVLTGVTFGGFTVTYLLPTGCMVTGLDTIQQAPKVSFYVNPNVCIGDTVKVELTSSSNGILNYTWNFGLANMIASSSNSFGPFYVSWSAGGVYNISVTGNASVLCPSLSAQDTIMVHNFPNASIMTPIFLNGNGTTLCTGDSVMLQAAYQDLRYSYFWTPANFFEQNYLGTEYARIGNAGYVYLTVHDQYGCTATDSTFINAQSCCQVSIPNAFSPNGDGLNDIFRPIGLGTHGIHIFRVVNRWGQSVFETVSNKAGWDGLFNGVPQEIGTYYYYLSYDCDGKTIVEKGEVTLVR